MKAEQLPPLPPGDWQPWDGAPVDEKFSADQMRAFAVEAVNAERERCAKLAEGMGFPEPGGAWDDACDSIADAIRNQP